MGAESTASWNRYRLFTRSVDDCRPVVFDPAYPWWCSGYGQDQRGDYAIVIAYLPASEDVLTYWPDAEVDGIGYECDIKFTSRFPCPNWYVPQVTP